MQERDPRINVQTCLAELHRLLAAAGAAVQAVRDEQGRACLELADLRQIRRRIYVVPQFYWFVWGDGPLDRHSVFQVTEAAGILTRIARTDGWPAGRPPPDLTPYLRYP